MGRGGGEGGESEWSLSIQKYKKLKQGPTDIVQCTFILSLGAGEEITDCYTPSYDVRPKAERSDFSPLYIKYICLSDNRLSFLD